LVVGLDLLSSPLTGYERASLLRLIRYNLVNETPGLMKRIRRSGGM
jgi:hypothetical protein